MAWSSGWCRSRIPLSSRLKTWRGRPIAFAASSPKRGATWRPWILVVFPEYALHGLSMDTNPAIMCRLDGPEVERFARRLHRQRHLGLLLHHGVQSHGNPFNSGLIIDDKGEIQLYYRKMHPWVPVEPWEPGDTRHPGVRRAERLEARADHLPRRHVPEMARECGLQGRRRHASRTAGYTAPIRQSWHFTNQSNAFCNLMYTASVCLCRLRRLVQLDGRRHDRELRRHAARLRQRHLLTRSSPPRCGLGQCDEARMHWGVENNIYQFGHRGLRRGEGRRARLPLHLHARSRRWKICAAVGEKTSR